MSLKPRKHWLSFCIAGSQPLGLSFNVTSSKKSSLITLTKAGIPSYFLAQQHACFTCRLNSHLKYKIIFNVFTCLLTASPNQVVKSTWSGTLSHAAHRYSTINVYWMSKGTLITFYSCEVYSLNLIIELRMSNFMPRDFFFLWWWNIVHKIYYFLGTCFGGIQYIHTVCNHYHHPSPKF